TVRSTPGVKTALLILEESGEAMLEGYSDNRPFALRIRDLTRVSEKVRAFVDLVMREGASVMRRDEASGPVFDVFKSDVLLVVPVRAASTPVGVIIASDPAEDVNADTAVALGLLARATGDLLEMLQLARGSYLISE